MLKTYPIPQAKMSKPFLQIWKTLCSGPTTASSVCGILDTPHTHMGEIMMCGNFVRRKLWKGASWMAGGRLAFCPFCPRQIGRWPSRKPNPPTDGLMHWGGQGDGWCSRGVDQSSNYVEYQIESIECPLANLTTGLNPLFCWWLIRLIWPPCSWLLSSTWRSDR